jgi:hypothetical protein
MGYLNIHGRPFAASIAMGEGLIAHITGVAVDGRILLLLLENRRERRRIALIGSPHRLAAIHSRSSCCEPALTIGLQERG